MKKRKGASTIFVLFMIIVLVTIGLFTIFSANINYKLSEKALDWNKTYYELDFEGEKQLAEIDTILMSCEKETVQDVLGNFDMSNSYSENDIYNYMNNLYKNKVLEELYELEKESSQSIVNVIYGEGEEIEALEYYMVVKSEINPSFELQIVIEVKDIPYYVDTVENAVVVNKVLDEKRYDIKSWKQYQEIEEVVPEMEIWNPDEEFEIIE